MQDNRARIRVSNRNIEETLLAAHNTLGALQRDSARERSVGRRVNAALIARQTGGTPYCRPALDQRNLGSESASTHVPPVKRRDRVLRGEPR